MNEIEKAFKEEVREKKRAANGVHSKKGKRGFVRGGVKTPADMLSGKERRAYEQPSEVTTSNIYYDKIMNLDEFKALSRQKKMLVLDAYKRKYKVSEIASTWNLSPNSVYYYFKSYLNASASEEQDQPTSQHDTNIMPAKDVLQISSKNECVFTLMGDFDAHSLGKKLNGLAFMLNDKRKYACEIHVKEIPY